MALEEIPFPLLCMRPMVAVGLGSRGVFVRSVAAWRRSWSTYTDDEEREVVVELSSGECVGHVGFFVRVAFQLR